MNILCIPDTHIPFQHKNALKFTCKVRDKYKIDRVVFMGDLTDQYSLSRYAKDPDALTTTHEFDLSKKEISRWIKEFPKAQVVIGNHESRIVKRLADVGIPSNLLFKTFNELWDIPKTWVWDHEVFLDGITFIHGVKSGPNAHILTAKDYRTSTVVAHTHSTLAVNWMSGPTDSIFAMNSGCLIDERAMAFKYASEMTSRPVLGCGVIIDGNPIVIKMEL